jgi:hypothetical protein
MTFHNTPYHFWSRAIRTRFFMYSHVSIVLYKHVEIYTKRNIKWTMLSKK